MKTIRCCLCWLSACFSLALVLGCSPASPANGSLTCGSGSHPCPEGDYCASSTKTCWKNGTGPDAGSGNSAGGAAGSSSWDGAGAMGGNAEAGAGTKPSLDGALDLASSAGGDGGTTTAFGGAGGTGSGGSSAPDAPNATGGTTATPDASTIPDGSDAPLTSPSGTACTGDGQCASGHCIDGVCCATACTGCNACSNSQTGKPDGTCAPVTSGQDPHAYCADETASNQCGNDGTCDGKGACRKVSSSHVCTKASCSSDGKTFTPVTTCDGIGACTTATAQDCGGFQCAVTGCLTTCASQDRCIGSTYCDTSAGTCAAKKPNGSPATQSYECTSGIVADGVCCDKTCTGCSACTATLNGQAASTTGQCLPVVANRVAPHNACTADLPCGEDGNCDGNGGCHYPSSGTSCADSTCAGSTFTTSKCDSAHACTPNPNPCPGSLICGSATACKTGCIGDGDCISGYYCASGTCTTKIDDGHACTPGADNQCKNGNCVSGICCHTACSECHTCSTGTCNQVGNGTACGTGVCNNGACNDCSQGATCTEGIDECHIGATDCSTGSAVCQASAKPTGTTCGSGPTCTGVGTSAKAYGHWTCQSGTCAQPTSYTSCPSTGCNTAGTACNNACDQGTQTICGTTCCTTASQYCNNNTSCAGKIQDGTACLGDNQCVHGNCSTYPADGSKVCCQSGYSNCASMCVNELTNNSNCGACNKVCPAADSCSGGVCNCALGAKMTCGSCSGWTFESGLEGWGWQGDISSFATSSFVSHSGSNSLAVTVYNNYDVTAVSVVPCPGSVDLATNGPYSLSGYFYSQGGQGTSCQIGANLWTTYSPPYDSLPGSFHAGLDAGVWVHVTLQFATSPFATNTDQIGFSFGGCDGTIYIDDVLLTPTP